MKLRLTLALALTLGPLTACDAAAGGGGEAVSCAAGSIRAQGSSAQANAVSSWIKDYQVNCPEATIAYGSSGSGAGVRAFIAGDAAFAGTDSSLSAAEQAAADARCGSGPAVHLPAVIGPIALVYNVAGAGDLRLAPATVAKVFAGAVTTWDDPAIAADNPGAALPSTTIRTVHRGDGSGTTDNFTAFLTAAAGADWTFGSSSAWRAPGGSAQRGSNGIATAVARTDGAIGYVEASYARFHNLATARIGNGAGEFVALTDDAAARTVADAAITGRGGDLRLTVDYRSAAAGAYPIVLVTYEVVCGSGAAELTRSFLAYAVSPAGQA
ncbi:phosphate ABC transporter substrate-binding protein PstS, partial [Actinoplanes sp. NPDC026623]|uniref:phosphate ABC transporter substrate-binding protein PstS n=1 Tax=Actinoplanes sp. NPDC026623 TaxID=3155610 RepID=UPI0033D3DA2F